MSELREKLKKIPEMFLYQRYIDNKLAEDFILDLCKYVDRINTPKHETVEELREAYTAIVDLSEGEVGEFSGCSQCGGHDTIGKHLDTCVVIRAEKWLENHGKPEEHNV